MPIFDMFMIGLLISSIGGLLLSKCYEKKILIGICLAICLLLVVGGVYFNYKGMNMNYTCIDSNRNIATDNGNDKMPIPSEIASKYLANPDEANNVNHKVMKKDDIKDYNLCDQFYTNKFPFVKHLFYSTGDIFKYLGVVMAVAGFFSLVWGVIIVNKRVA
ncbi:DUF5317 family protein [Clostridium beijerinckii]|uniref:Uncharacterized protein n=1 Tax=Clostridium beijerinckii TaxID=1520 RepID=A0A1S9NAT7_CLOBE|nr:DUF5317 family protein [Clostridium beijerinckii]OOP74664.1 hypothetical protein CBEIBR21_00415 [Clostridium beijerinckii]